MYSHSYIAQLLLNSFQFAVDAHVNEINSVASSIVMVTLSTRDAPKAVVTIHVNFGWNGTRYVSWTIPTIMVFMMYPLIDV